VKLRDDLPPRGRDKERRVETRGREKPEKREEEVEDQGG